ncbi:Arm DNA-binding domain-containing protein, partial [Thauera sp. ZXT1-4]|uniref:Arm DNA-binding domain-containing protein n=1 Tax=Thauera sp. ZXT1-4 TaxID=3460294 RepID=UPI004040B7FB
MGSIRKHSQTGFLFFDFRYQGVRCREYTALPETAPNKKKLEKVLSAIEADIAAGTFDYRRFFPGSKNAAKFDPAPGGMVGSATAAVVALPSAAASVASTPRFKDFAETWFAEKEVEWRRSYRTTIRRE